MFVVGVQCELNDPFVEKEPFFLLFMQTLRSKNLCFVHSLSPTITFRFDNCIKENDCSIYNRFEEQCQIRPYSVALVFEGTSYTWKDLELGKDAG